MDEPTEQDFQTDAAVDEFWNLARFHAKLNDIPSYFGPTPLEAVQPPAWAFGGSPEESQQSLEALLSGARTSNEMALSDFSEAGERLPEVGTLGIVLDALGQPRALVATTAVEVAGEQVVEHLSVLYASEG